MIDRDAAAQVIADGLRLWRDNDFRDREERVVPRMRRPDTFDRLIVDSHCDLVELVAAALRLIEEADRGELEVEWSEWSDRRHRGRATEVLDDLRHVVQRIKFAVRA